MKDWWARLERRFIKHRLATSDPASLVRRGSAWLLPCFRRAARRSSAYRSILAEAQVDPASIHTPEDFVRLCPILGKDNTFQRFEIAQLLTDDVLPRDLASILTSSGHGGSGFALGMSTRTQKRRSTRLIDIGLELAFDIDARRTLLINCLPMGVTFDSDTVCVANVSVREDMACAIVRQAGSLFEQIVLCGDPLFLKRLCDYSSAQGLEWERHRVHVIVGEETFPESFRDYLARVLCVEIDSPDGGLIGSSMGVGELGLNLFNETRETVALRRACRADPALLRQLTGVDLANEPLPTFLCYNPLRTFVEVIDPDTHGVGDLVVTVMDESAPVPLMRYRTGDLVQRLPRESAAGVLGALRLPPAPMVALHGRIKDRLSHGGHVDLFKESIYRYPEVARHLSGAHRITQQRTGITWEVQAARGDANDVALLSKQLHDAVASRLPGQSLTVKVLAYELFPHGMTIDYERKFIYLAQATQ